MTYLSLQAQAEALHLSILGGFHSTDEDQTPKGTGTLLLIGPNEPEFWPAFTKASEWQDGKPDPMDRWSSRVISHWAQEIGATALFPFGGAPYLPFFSWAKRSGRIHESPIMLLVHDTAGLFVSFRGALALPQKIELPLPPPSPCGTCTGQPCLTACPVNAFDTQAYDVPVCKNYLDSVEGSPCMALGCEARRACPVSLSYPRLPEQSAYHMTKFKG